MPFLRIAHRGASGTRPEHTRPSFLRAIELGVDMIELDVQLTRDRQLVVLHDRTLGRTVKGSGAVRDHDLADLCDRDAGAWFHPQYAGERVLSLAEVLDLTVDRVALNVEIKSPAPDWEPTAVVLSELLATRGAMASTVISSFDMGALRCVRVAAPAARLGVLWHTADVTAAWSHAEALGAGTMHLLWGLVDDAALATARRHRRPILTWTVNDVDVMQHLADGGVGGIISDFPERFASLRGA